MCKHILIATDGSEIANKAMPHAIELAKALGATLSAVTVTEPYDAVIAAEAQPDYNEQSEESAAEILSAITSAAEAEGIRCKVVQEQNRRPYKGIIDAAEKWGPI